MTHYTAKLSQNSHVIVNGFWFSWHSQLTIIIISSMSGNKVHNDHKWASATLSQRSIVCGNPLLNSTTRWNRALAIAIVCANKCTTARENRFESIVRTPIISRARVNRMHNNKRFNRTHSHTIVSTHRIVGIRFVSHIRSLGRSFVRPSLVCDNSVRLDHSHQLCWLCATSTNKPN